MKKYFLLYLGSLLLVNSPSWSMSEDGYDENDAEDTSIQDEDGYDRNGDMSMQNGVQNGMMIRQPGAMLPDGTMNQGMFPNGAMMQQSGMVLPDGTMNSQAYQNGDEYAHTDNDEYVRSLVNNILQMKNEQQNQVLNKTKNGGIVVSKNLKNKILRLQKELDEISLSLKGISTSDDTAKEKSLQKSKSSDKSVSKGKKSSKKSIYAKSKSYIKKLWNRKDKFLKFSTSKGEYKIKTLLSSKKAQKFSNFNWMGSLHTVKQLTRKNAKKFVPEHRFSRNYSSGQSKVKKYKSSAPVKYKVKILGTGEIIPIDVYYQKNTSYSPEKSNSPKNSNYFSDKSKCDNGCGVQ